MIEVLSSSHDRTATCVNIYVFFVFIFLFRVIMYDMNLLVVKAL